MKSFACFRAFILVLPALFAGLLSAAAQETPDLSIPRVGALSVPTQMHGTAVIGQRLYTLGGETPTGWNQAVRSAPVDADGKIGSWREETPLPAAMAYLNNCNETVGNRIYLLGGMIADSPGMKESAMRRSVEVLWNVAGPDGTLGEWKKSSSFPGPPIGFLAACSTDRQLLVCGGCTTNTVRAAVFLADFTPEGEPVNWRLAGHLPIPLWQHGAALQGGRLYVWGGLKSRRNCSQLTTDPADINTGAWSAELLPDGQLGPWRDEIPMPSPTFAAAYSGFNDFLVGIGGRYQDKSPTNAIWYARLEEGKIQSWKVVRTDLDARVYHSLGLDKTQGRIFVAGGQKKTVAGQQGVNRLDTVQAFQIPQPENTRLNVSEVAAARPEQGAAQGGGSEFTPLEQALRSASQQKRPVLAFFYSPQVPDCRRFWDRVVRTPAFQALERQYILSAVDISGTGSELGPRYHIYKVPALAVIGPDGARLASSITVQDIEDVRKMLGAGQ